MKYSLVAVSLVEKTIISFYTIAVCRPKIATPHDQIFIAYENIFPYIHFFSWCNCIFVPLRITLLANISCLVGQDLCQLVTLDNNVFSQKIQLTRNGKNQYRFDSLNTSSWLNRKNYLVKTISFVKINNERKTHTRFSITHLWLKLWTFKLVDTLYCGLESILFDNTLLFLQTHESFTTPPSCQSFIFPTNLL